jgi:hypothetical protein
MAGEWTLDFLTVARHDEPPAPDVVVRALTGAGLGEVAYPAAMPPDTGSLATGRQRLGAYALREAQGRATGRITVVRHEQPVLVGMGEAPFTVLTLGLGSDDARTLREGRLALNLRVTVADPAGAAYLGWATRVLLVLLGVTEGAAVDPAAQRCYGRVQLAGLTAATSPTAQVAVHADPWGYEAFWLHTHGVQKMGRPELELVGVPRVFVPEARALLRDLIEQLAGGARLAVGQEVDLEELGRLVALAAPCDVDHEAPFGRRRLVDAPAPGTALGTVATRLLARTVLADAARRAVRGDLPAALEAVERLLGALPEDGAALAYKSELLLRTGQALSALEVGELLELRTPGDARGALTVGRALAALGRAREAERAFTRAIGLDPDDPAAYAARAQARETLGQVGEAASDRARAAYLRE